MFKYLKSLNILKLKKKDKMTKTFPKFEVTPDHVIFRDFKDCCTYTQKISIVNQDQSLHQLNVTFEKNPTLSVNVEGDQRIPPGLNIIIDLVFNPEINSKQMKNDERYEIHLVSRRANYKYAIPIIILSTYPTINFPKEIVMPRTSPYITTYSTMFVCNYGQIPYKFSFDVDPKTFHVRPCLKNICIKPNDHRIFIFEYTPRMSGKLKELIKVIFENHETHIISVRINSYPCDITLSEPVIEFPETFYGLTNSATINIINKSTADVSFEWCNHKFSKKHHYIDSPEKRDAFANPAFQIIPATGKIISESSFPVTVKFTPTTDNDLTEENERLTKYLVKAYLKTSTETYYRTKLYMQGIGLGAQIKLSYTSIFIGQVYMGRRKSYLIECTNIGLIPGYIRYCSSDAVFGGIVTVTPSELYVDVKGKGYFQLDYVNQNVGKILEQIYFQIDYGEQIKVILTGEILQLTVKTAPEEINFGVVPICVPQVKYIYIRNPLPCSLKIKLEFERQGDEDPLCFEELLIKPVTHDQCHLMNPPTYRYISDTKLCDDVINREVPVLRPTISAVLAVRDTINLTMANLNDFIKKYLEEQDVVSTICCAEFALKAIMSDFIGKVESSDLESGIEMASRLWTLLLDNLMKHMEHQALWDMLFKKFMKRIKKRIKQMIREDCIIRHLPLILANETITLFLDKICDFIEAPTVCNEMLDLIFDNVMEYFEKIDIVGFVVDDILEDLIEKYERGDFRDPTPEPEPLTYMDIDWVLAENPRELTIIPDNTLLAPDECKVFEVMLRPNLVGKSFKTLLIKTMYLPEKEPIPEECEEEEIQEECEIDVSSRSTLDEDIICEYDAVEPVVEEEEVLEVIGDIKELAGPPFPIPRKSVEIGEVTAEGYFPYDGGDVGSECVQEETQDEENALLQKSVCRVPVNYECVIPELKLNKYKFEVNTYVEMDASLFITIKNESLLDCFLNNMLRDTESATVRVLPAKYHLRGKSEVVVEYILNSKLVGCYDGEFNILVLGLPKDKICITIDCIFLAPEFAYSPVCLHNKAKVSEPSQCTLNIENLSPTILRFTVHEPTEEEVTISPLGAELGPGQSAILEINLIFMDPGSYKNYIDIDVQHLKSLRVPIKSTIKGSPFKFLPPIEPYADLGTVFLLRHPQHIDLQVQNYGKFSYIMILTGLKKNNPHISVQPSKVHLEPCGKAMIKVILQTHILGVTEEEFMIEAIKERSNKRLLIGKTMFMVTTINPNFGWSTDNVILNIYDDGVAPSYSFKKLTLTNKTSLNIQVNCTTEGEFTLLSLNSFLPQNHLSFEMIGKGTAAMTVCFNTALVKKHNSYVEFLGKLKVSAQGNCQNVLNLKACIFYPILCISENISDFLTNLLPFQFTYILHNPGPLVAVYDMHFVEENCKVLRIAEFPRNNIGDDLFARTADKTCKDIYLTNYLADDEEERLKSTLFYDSENENDDEESVAGPVAIERRISRPKRGSRKSNSSKLDLGELADNSLDVVFDGQAGEKNFEDIIMSARKLTTFLVKGDLNKFDEDFKALEQKRMNNEKLREAGIPIDETKSGVENAPSERSRKVSKKGPVETFRAVNKPNIERIQKKRESLPLNPVDGIPEGNQIIQVPQVDLGKAEDYFDISSMNAEIMPNYNRLLAFNFKKSDIPVMVCALVKIDVHRGQPLYIDLTVTNSHPNIHVSATKFDLGVLPWYEILRRTVVISNIGSFPFYLNLSFDKYSSKDKRLIEGFIRKPNETEFYLDAKSVGKSLKFFCYLGIGGKFRQDVGVIANCNTPINITFTGCGKIPFLTLLSTKRSSLNNIDTTFAYLTLRDVFNKEIMTTVIPDEIVSSDDILKYKYTNESLRQSKAIKNRRRSKRDGDRASLVDTDSFALLDQPAEGATSATEFEQPLKFAYDEFGAATYTYAAKSSSSGKLLQMVDEDLEDFVVLDYPEQYPNVIEITNMLETFGFTTSLYTVPGINLEFREIAKKHSLQKLSPKEILKFGKPDLTVRPTNFRIQALPFIVSEYELELGEVNMNEIKTAQIPVFYHGPGKMKITVRSTIAIPGLRLAFIKPSGDMINNFTVLDYPPEDIPEKDDCGDPIENLHYKNMQEREALSAIAPKKCDIKHAHSFDFNTSYIHTRDEVTISRRAAVVAHYNALSQNFKTYKHPFTLCEIYQDRPTINNKFCSIYMEFEPIDKYYAPDTQVDDYLFVDVHLGPSLPVHLTATVLKTDDEDLVI